MSPYDHWLTSDTAYEADSARAEAIDALVDRLAADPAKVAEADEWIAGTLDYEGLETDLADLHNVPADRLIGSDALVRILRRAQAANEARADRLRLMAEEQIDRDAADAADMRVAA